MSKMTKRSKLFLTLILIMAFSFSLALSAAASAPSAQAVKQKDMWWLIGTFLAILDAELVAVIVLGIIIGLKKKHASEQKLMAVFPIALSVLMPAATPLVCILLGVGILGLGGVIIYQSKTLVALKKKAAEPAEVAPAEETKALDEIEMIDTEQAVDADEIVSALAAPAVILSEIDYDDEDDEDIITEDGVEIISVVWPERPHHNKLYRYSPNGVKFEPGEIVLVPTRDVKRNREVLRKAAIVHGNHRVDPSSLPYELKKVIGKVKPGA